MIFLYIYLVISVACLILFTLSTFDIAHTFKTRYPSIKLPRNSWASEILGVLRIILTSVCPILNIILLLSIVINYENLKEKTIRSLYGKHIDREIAEMRTQRHRTNEEEKE